MSVPSGTFTAPKTGLLHVDFTGLWDLYSLDRANRYSATPTAQPYLLVDCSVTTPAGTETITLSAETPSGRIVVPVTSGQSVTVAMAHAGHGFSSGSGYRYVSAYDLRIRCSIA